MSSSCSFSARQRRSALVGLELVCAALMPIAPPPRPAPCGGCRRKCTHPSNLEELVCVTGFCRRETS